MARCALSADMPTSPRACCTCTGAAQRSHRRPRTSWPSSPCRRTWPPLTCSSSSRPTCLPSPASASSGAARAPTVGSRVVGRGQSASLTGVQRRDQEVGTPAHSDAVANRSIALMRFRDALAAQAFHDEYDRRPFSSLEARAPRPSAARAAPGLIDSPSVALALVVSTPCWSVFCNRGAHRLSSWRAWLGGQPEICHAVFVQSVDVKAPDEVTVFPLEERLTEVCALSGDGGTTVSVHTGSHQRGGARKPWHVAPTRSSCVSGPAAAHVPRVPRAAGHCRHGRVFSCVPPYLSLPLPRKMGRHQVRSGDTRNQCVGGVSADAPPPPRGAPAPSYGVPWR